MNTKKTKISGREAVSIGSLIYSESKKLKHKKSSKLKKLAQVFDEIGRAHV